MKNARSTPCIEFTMETKMLRRFGTSILHNKGMPVRRNPLFCSTLLLYGERIAICPCSAPSAHFASMFSRTWYISYHNRGLLYSLMSPISWLPCIVDVSMNVNGAKSFLRPSSSIKFYTNVLSGTRMRSEVKVVL